jgi:hypothetical protein
MAGANLARITSQSEGTTFALFGINVPMSAIWAVSAISVDAVIVLCPFAIGYCYKKKDYIVLIIALALWGFCSIISIQNVHDLLHEKIAKTAEPSLKEEKKYIQTTKNLEQAKLKMAEIEAKLLNEEDYGKRKNLNEAKKDKRAEITTLEEAVTNASVFHVEQVDEGKIWVIAIGLWGMSVGCWIVFMREDELPKNSFEKQGRGRGMNASGNVVELHPKMAENLAVAKALEMRAQTPPASWEEISRVTGWPLSSIYRKAAQRRHALQRG